MKRVAMIMPLFLGIALGVGEALAASSREPPRAQPSAVPTAE